MVSDRNRIPSARYTLLRFFANSTPTDDTFRQCGHLAKAFVNVLNYENVISKSVFFRIYKKNLLSLSY